jgi:hypothetical protein
MAARMKSSKNYFYLILVLAIAVFLLYLFLAKVGPFQNQSSSNGPVSKATAKPEATQSTVATQGSVSGPVGRNGLTAYPGPGVGEVTLEWQRFFPDGENFSIHYGTVSKVYPYAATYVGYISTYTVKGLTPGTRYYFVVEGIRVGNVSAGWDGEVSAVAPASAVNIAVTAGPVGRNLLTVKAGPKKGQATLSWTRFYKDTEKYNVVYGTKPGVYSYGLLNAIDTTPQDNQYLYVIGSLSSGTRYYFALIPQRSGTGTYVTSEVSVVAP